MDRKWNHGNVRIRGKRENIIHFLQEELVSIYLLEDDKTEERPVIIEQDFSGYELRIRKSPETESRVWFRGSTHNCIDFDGFDDIHAEMSEGHNKNKDQVLFLPGYYGSIRVELDADEDVLFFQEKAKQYKVDLRIFVWKPSMDWVSSATWYRNGIFEKETTRYAGWLWDSPLPDYGNYR